MEMLTDATVAVTRGASGIALAPARVLDAKLASLPDGAAVR